MSGVDDLRGNVKMPEKKIESIAELRKAVDDWANSWDKAISVGQVFELRAMFDEFEASVNKLKTSIIKCDQVSRFGCNECRLYPNCSKKGIISRILGSEVSNSLTVKPSNRSTQKQ